MPKQPETSDILALYRHLNDTVWPKCHGKFETIDSFIWGTFPVWTKPEHKDRPIWRPSTAANIVAAASDNQLAYVPKVHIVDIAESAVRKKRKELLENFLEAVFYDSSLMEPVLPWKQLGKYLVTYGYGIVDGPRLDFTDKEEAEGEGNWNPFRIRAPHPSRILLDPTEKRPREGLKVWKEYAKDLEDLSLRKAKTPAEGRWVKEWYRPGEMSPYQTIDVMEYFSKDWHILMTQAGEVIFVEPNTWGFCPFLHAFGGWGMETSSQDGASPEKQAVGILEWIQDTLKAQAQEWSSGHNLMMRQAWAPFGTTRAPEEVAQQLAQDGILEGRKDDYWTLETLKVDDWMFRLGEKYAQDIEDGTFTKPIRGGREPGVTTMGQHAMQLQAAQRKFRPLQEQMNQMATIVAQRILKLIEIYGEPLTVGGFKVKPEDVGKDYAVRVTFELVDPVLQLQAREVGMREVGMGLKSGITYREHDLRIENEQQEQERLYEDKLNQHPAVVEAGVEAIAKQKGMEEVIKRWEEQQELAAAGGAPGGGPGPGGLRQPLSEETTKPGQTMGMEG